MKNWKNNNSVFMSLPPLMCIMILACVVMSCREKNEASEKVQVVESEEDLMEGKKYSTWMANSVLKRNPKGWTLDFQEEPKWEYTHGLIMTAMEKVWEATGEEKYLDYIKNFADFMVNEEGGIKTYKKSDYNIDRVQGGRFLIGLYEETGRGKYKKAIEMLRDQMREHPRTEEGGFWHKKVYPHQMWLDGLYMGSPFLARYAATYNEPELFDDVANQIILIDKYTYNKEVGLYHHGWDESREQRWADPETGLSKNFWGRSIGWFGMALVDVLDYLPEDHPKRKDIIEITRKLARGIVRYQDETGVWYQVVDQGDRKGNYLESSASTMFTYFLLKGAKKGYLDPKFKKAGVRAYKGVLEQFIKEEPNGSLTITNVCAVAGLGGDPYRDGSYEYYINELVRENDPKGVGPFILASLQYESLKK